MLPDIPTIHIFCIYIITMIEEEKISIFPIVILLNLSTSVIGWVKEIKELIYMTTKSIVLYKDNRNNETIAFPSPSERNEQKTFGGLLLDLTKSGSIYLVMKSSGTYLGLNTDRGTKTFKLSSSYRTYDEVRNFSPEHCLGYKSDSVYLGGSITVYINKSGISVVFHTEDEDDEV